jgi:hypothetical protein
LGASFVGISFLSGTLGGGSSVPDGECMVGAVAAIGGTASHQRQASGPDGRYQVFGLPAGISPGPFEVAMLWLTSPGDG